ncbi:MAG TPA: thioredoxin domain-containing protein [Candidatus Gastranaerophilaceae bacterium]|nr:thioredoxin domain-containing protein [Candidatus Gastranaerophilaceae bacterium]HPT40851.1 thioredoxin domain-containing protein [Candidatus Gastranaerophilaceae bacterium]
MKKILMILGIIIAICVTSAVTMAFAPKKNLKPSDYSIGITYEQAVKDKKPFIALFYADWCSYCIRFMPKYKLISDIYKDKYNFVMINVENPKYQKLVEDYSISGFPSIFIIDKQIDNRIPLYNGIYDDLGKLRGELDRYLKIRSMIKK